MFQEASTKVVNIEDADAKHVEPLIDFLYRDSFEWSSECPDFDIHDVFQMVLFADRYQLPEPCSKQLQTKFKDFLSSDVKGSAEACAQYLAKSYEIDLPWLRETTVGQIKFPDALYFEKDFEKDLFGGSESETDGKSLIDAGCVLNVLLDDAKMQAVTCNAVQQALFMVSHKCVAHALKIDTRSAVQTALKHLTTCLDKIIAQMRSSAELS